MIRVGVIGYGYWGPNIVRNFNIADKSEVVMVCDELPEALNRVRHMHPYVQVTASSADVLASPDIDVVAVVTPVWTHFKLAKAALNHFEHDGYNYLLASE